MRVAANMTLKKEKDGYRIEGFISYANLPRDKFPFESNDTLTDIDFIGRVRHAPDLSEVPYDG